FRYFPNSAVRYPASWRYRSMVERWKAESGQVTPREGSTRNRMWWLCAYLPVKIDAREGQQRGVVTNAAGKLTPPCSNQRCVFGITSSVPVARWSSVTMSRMFG